MSRQSLVGGNLVDESIQEEFGLLSLSVNCSSCLLKGSGACSASLLRNTWAITAAHCVEDSSHGRTIPDPNRTGQNILVPPASITLTASWGGVQQQQAAWVETFRPYDIAIIRVATPFMVKGSTTNYNREVFPEDAFPYWGEEVPLLIKVFGRGISQFAYLSSNVAIPSASDGLYRVGWAKTQRETSNLYWYPSEGGQMIAGGDSGGPSLTWVQGYGYVLVGVHSLCKYENLSGMSTDPDDPWKWVQRTPEAADAPVKPVWGEIRRFIGAPPQRLDEMESYPPPGYIGTFSSTPPDFRPFWLYGIQEDGVLQWYRKDSGTSPWQGPNQVGYGWSGFKEVIPAGGNRFFAIADDGVLRWYEHEGFNRGTPEWKGPVEVGQNWNDGRRVFGGGSGIIYVIRPDGTLEWSRYGGLRVGSSKPFWYGPTVIGSGWAQFKEVFSTGQGKIYAVDPDGDLWLYEHTGFDKGDAAWASWPRLGGVGSIDRRRVGTGWQGFKKIIPTTEGRILAIREDGKLVVYKHLGHQIKHAKSKMGIDKYEEIWEGPTELGSNWQFYKDVFSSIPDPVSMVK